ncbi:hypothetical protein MNBD_ALPHA12-996 [hydrothermal vent metagenome]|uniref:Uncharacterized protein n=1 Tax=hydrothermal vent metagenome TaxID=652676 RepID=A0A3B0TC86_9ZZZZ
MKVCARNDGWLSDFIETPREAKLTPPAFYSRRRRGLCPLPRPPLFIRAAVAGYARFPGPRFLFAPPSRAMPASPAPPPEERAHIKIGKGYKDFPQKPNASLIDHR